MSDWVCLIGLILGGVAGVCDAMLRIRFRNKLVEQLEEIDKNHKEHGHFDPDSNFERLAFLKG